jgi:hypothetical protein
MDCCSCREKQLTPGITQSSFFDPFRGLDFLHLRG